MTRAAILLFVACLMGSNGAAFAQEAVDECGRWIGDHDKAGFARQGFGEIAINNKSIGRYFILGNDSCAKFQRHETIRVSINHNNNSIPSEYKNTDSNESETFGIAGIQIGLVHFSKPDTNWGAGESPHKLQLMRNGNGWKRHATNGDFLQLNRDSFAFLSDLNSMDETNFNTTYKGITGSSWFERIKFDDENEISSWIHRGKFILDESILNNIKNRSVNFALSNSLIGFKRPTKGEPASKFPDLEVLTRDADCIFVRTFIVDSSGIAIERHATIQNGKETLCSRIEMRPKNSSNDMFKWIFARFALTGSSESR